MVSVDRSVKLCNAPSSLKLRNLHLPNNRSWETQGRPWIFRYSMPAMIIDPIAAVPLNTSIFLCRQYASVIPNFSKGYSVLCSIKQITAASTILWSLSVAVCATLSSSLGFDGSGSGLSSIWIVAGVLSGTSAHLCPGGIILFGLGFGGGAGAAFGAGTTFPTG